MGQPSEHNRSNPLCIFGVESEFTLVGPNSPMRPVTPPVRIGVTAWALRPSNGFSIQFFFLGGDRRQYRSDDPRGVSDGVLSRDVLPRESIGNGLLRESTSRLSQ